MAWKDPIFSWLGVFSLVRRVQIICKMRPKNGVRSVIVTVSFNRLSLCVQAMAVILFCGTLQAEEVTWLTTEEVLEMQANAYCSMTEEVHQQCFDMNLIECSSVYQTTMTTCAQSYSLLNPSVQSTLDQFQECYMNEFISYIQSKGLSLDDLCE